MLGDLRRRLLYLVVLMSIIIPTNALRNRNSDVDESSSEQKICPTRLEHLSQRAGTSTNGTIVPTGWDKIYLSAKIHNVGITSKEIRRIFDYIILRFSFFSSDEMINQFFADGNSTFPLQKTAALPGEGGADDSFVRLKAANFYLHLVDQIDARLEEAFGSLRLGERNW